MTDPDSLLHPRVREGVLLLGPDLFAVDEQGDALAPIASVFPRHQAVVAGRGIHAGLAGILAGYLRRRDPETLGEAFSEEEIELYQDAVPVLIRGSTVLIRSDPDDMSHCFAADELLQRLVPKKRIQFTCPHLCPVRQELRRRGESWRSLPPPRTVDEVRAYIRSSRVRVKTGTVYYQNVARGGRYLTYQEFLAIRPLLQRDPGEARARVEEILELHRLLNEQGAREVSFFLPVGSRLDTRVLEELAAVLREESPGGNAAQALAVFDRFAAEFAESAGVDLSADDLDNPVWRTTMFCRLLDIEERDLEEWALGLSPEFHLNVQWLPGACLQDGVRFEPNVEPRVRGLIEHYHQVRPEAIAINVGRVRSSQTKRDRTGEHREVFLVVLTRPDESEDIRLVRMIKWDVQHRLERGADVEQAVRETVQYRDYVFDRLRAAAALELPIPPFHEIHLEETVAGRGRAPVFFFERPYVNGVATDKISLAQYRRPGFLPRLAELLGRGAAASLVLGRACPRTGRLYFDDGDEMVILDEDMLPDRLLLAETTGSFNDTTTPLPVLLDTCLDRVALHFERARGQGASAQDLESAVRRFAEGLAAEIERMQKLVRDPASGLREMFAERTRELGGIRRRWEAMLARLEAADPAALREQVESAPRLRLSAP